MRRGKTFLDRAIYRAKRTPGPADFAPPRDWDAGITRAGAMKPGLLALLGMGGQSAAAADAARDLVARATEAERTAASRAHAILGMVVGALRAEMASRHASFSSLFRDFDKNCGEYYYLRKAGQEPRAVTGFELRY